MAEADDGGDAHAVHDEQGNDIRPEDLVAIRESCEYVSNVFKQFNDGIDSMPKEAKAYVEKLNAEVLASVKQVSDDKSCTKKVKKEKVNSPANTEDEEPDSDCSYSTTTSTLESVKGRNQKRKDKGRYSMNELMSIMQRLDTRMVPKPEEFDSASGQPLQEYLDMFEGYCRSNFRGSSVLWIGELGRLLTGDMHQAFQVLRVPGDSYRVIKKKLIRWYEDSSEVREMGIKAKFTSANRQKGEPTRLFGARLEKLFRLAHPKKTLNIARPSETNIAELFLNH